MNAFQDLHPRLDRLHRHALQLLATTALSWNLSVH